MRLDKYIRLFSFALVFFLALSCFGCSDKYKSAEEAFSVFSDAYGNLPAGKLYLSRSSEWEDTYLPEEIIYSLYEGINGECEYDYVAESAIYLSTSLYNFYEVAIFICHSNSDTEAVAKMCHKRIDVARRLHSYANTDAIENARVEIHGRMVIMCVLPDAEGTARAFRALAR